MVSHVPTPNEWAGEVLFPGANARGYRLVFEAETWLRRICHAALLLAEGPAWASRLKADLRNRITAESKRNAERWYLGIDAGEELLWSTTHGQLVEILRVPVIQAVLRELCGMDGEVLAGRLASVSSVRNTLAHNRAISDETLAILEGDLTVIRAGVDQFKGKTLYAVSEIVSTSSTPIDLVDFTGEFQALEGDFPRQQLFASADRNFVSLVRLSVEPFDRWPSARRLRDALSTASHLVVCVLANKQGSELQVVLPRSLPDQDKIQVLRRFMTKEVLELAWTSTPPELQHAASATWPRLWFYENRRPDDD